MMQNYKRKTGISGLLAEATAVPIELVARDLEETTRPDGFAFELVAQGGRQYFRCLLAGHPDKNPTAYLNTSRWWCPVCGRGGDGVDLVAGVKGLDTRDALAWMKERYELGNTARTPDDPIAQLAAERKVRPESTGAYVSHTKVEYGHPVVYFARWTSPNAKEPVGWQKRRADDQPIAPTSGKRSIQAGHEPDDGLYMPRPWPEQDENSILLVTEGEMDAVAGHDIGFRHSVGTQGKNWTPGMEDVLRELMRSFPRAALIGHGDVPDYGDDGLRKKAERLGEGSECQIIRVRVPTWVAATPAERDLNEWLRRTDAKEVCFSIMRAVNGKVRFIALRDDALPDLRRTVEEYGGVLSKEQAHWHDRLALYLLQSIMPFGGRTAAGTIAVGPGEWFSSFPGLADDIGCKRWRVIRAIMEKWRTVGVLSWEKRTGSSGKHGVLIRWHNPSEFLL